MAGFLVVITLQNPANQTSRRRYSGIRNLGHHSLTFHSKTRNRIPVTSRPEKIE